MNEPSLKHPGIPADAGVREQALDPTGSFIVQAPAGSGKTELLTQRLLVLLARADAPEDILALTFTRKAAGEMRQRLLEILNKAAEASGQKEGHPTGGKPQPGVLSEGAPHEAVPSEVAPHETASFERARAVLERSASQGWNLLENPGRLRINTIDAYCAVLTARAPLRSGWGGMPAIATDTQAYYRQAAHTTLKHIEEQGPAGQAAAILLRHLDTQRGRAVDLLCTLLARRDQWLRHLRGGMEPPAFREMLESGLRELLTSGLMAVRVAMEEWPGGQEGDVLAELLALLPYAAEQASRLGLRVDVASLKGLAALPPGTPEGWPQWRALAGWLTTRNGTWRARPTKNEGFPTVNDGGDPTMKARMTALLDALRNDPGLAKSLRSVDFLPPPEYTGAQWEVMEALLVLLPIAAGHLRDAFAAGGEADYVEVAQAALRVLEAAADGGSDAMEHPAGMELGGARHLLVDEFQDTSHSQFELLRHLVEDWRPGDGNTLFLVGDPMQSIYRFREADVGLFFRVRDHGLGTVRPVHLTLRVNFRSGAPLVDWVNGAFKSILPSSDDPLTGAVPFVPSQAFHGEVPGCEVFIHPIVREDGETRENTDAAEAARVVEIVRYAQRSGMDGTDGTNGMNFSVAVLVRSRSHLSVILPALREAGFGFRAVEIEALAGRPVVQDLLSLTRALLNPVDRIAWLSLLRAPWCGLELADLILIAGEAPRVSLWSRIGDDQAMGALSASGRQRLQRLRDVMAHSLEATGRRPLRRWVEGAWLALGGPACYPRADLANARAFLQLLDTVEAARQGIAADVLVEWVEKLFALPDSAADERLQVMTVHRAKGLEFDTVILPGLGKPPKVSDKPLLRWMERPASSDAPGGLLLAPVHPTGGDDDPIFRYLGILEKEREDHEKCRLLYVAATRARRALHLIGHTGVKDGVPAEPPQATLLHPLWAGIAADFEAVLEVRDGKTDPAVDAGNSIPSTEPHPPPQPEPMLHRLPPDWQPPEPPPALNIHLDGVDDGVEPSAAQGIEFSWAGETARHVGTVSHRLLRLMAARGGVAAVQAVFSRAAIVSSLAALGVLSGDLERAAGLVERALANTLGDSRGAWILKAHREARGEYRIGGMVDGRPRTFIIDRTFIDADGTRWIIDFKTGGHEGGDSEAFLEREQERYRDQLEGYARLMASMDPDRPIRLGLYFPLLGGWREWPA
ncbi:MAG: UvrD-helicase domain-containing protein [bacterium]